MGYNIEELLENFFIHDCCILSDDYITVIAEEYLTEDEYAKDQLGAIKLINYVIGDNERGWGYRHWEEKNSFYKPKLVNIKPNEALVISNGGLVYYYGTGNNKQEEKNIPHEVSAGCYSVQKIDGDVYVTGVYRNVAIRRGVSHWENLSHSIAPNNSSAGFLSVDGFNKNDLYAAGGDNDVWRYDGEDWIPLDVADHFRPTVVCCASDGYVYIAGAWGMVVRGREDNWQQQFASKTDSFLFTSIVSYQGKVLLGTESDGTYVIVPDGDNFLIEPYDFEGEIEPFSARHMDTGYGMLMVASDHAIALHDGKKWQMLYENGLSELQGDMLVAVDLLEKTEKAINAVDKLFKKGK